MNSTISVGHPGLFFMLFSSLIHYWNKKYNSANSFHQAETLFSQYIFGIHMFSSGNKLWLMPA